MQLRLSPSPEAWRKPSFLYGLTTLFQSCILTMDKKENIAGIQGGKQGQHTYSASPEFEFFLPQPSGICQGVKTDNQGNQPNEEVQQKVSHGPSPPFTSGRGLVLILSPVRRILTVVLASTSAWGYFSDQLYCSQADQVQKKERV